MRKIAETLYLTCELGLELSFRTSGCDFFPHPLVGVVSGGQPV